MATLKKWKVYCTDESTYYEVWKDVTDPIELQCPVNTAHTLNGNLTIDVADHQVISKVFVVEEESLTTQGFFRTKGRNLLISGNVGDVTTDVLTWPYDTTILHGWFHTTNNHVGDQVSCYVSPGVVVGAIDAPVTAGDTEIVVSQTVMDNFAVGFEMEITDGVTSNKLGEVSAMNGNLFTVTTAATDNFSPLSPTYVKQTVVIVEDMPIVAPLSRYAFAEKKQRGKGLPANIPLVIQYNNLSGGEKYFAYTIEYMY